MSVLGWPGKLLGMSKSWYEQQHPKNIVVFNSNLIANFPKGPKKIWYGDIDITRDMDMLVEIAKTTGTKLSVLREMDGRFDYENYPLVKNFVFRTDGKTCEVGPKYIDICERDSDGRFVFK